MSVEIDWPHAYIAHHGVEPLVDVSELRSQTLDLDGTDDQPATRVKKACTASGTGKARSGERALAGPVLDCSEAKVTIVSIPWKPETPSAFAVLHNGEIRGDWRVLDGAGPGKHVAPASKRTMIAEAREGSRRRWARAAKKYDLSPRSFCTGQTPRKMAGSPLAPVLRSLLIRVGLAFHLTDIGLSFECHHIALAPGIELPLLCEGGGAALVRCEGLRGRYYFVGSHHR
jgi:hypothetical protein